MPAVAAAVIEELVEHHLAAVSLYLAGYCRPLWARKTENQEPNRSNREPN
jgi:hypothetical protein